MPKHKKRKSLQEFPRLSPEEYRSLEESILENGILQPVLFDTLGNIIDGHHRWDIAEKHGLEVPFEELKGLTKNDKRKLMIQMNIGRRQLKPTEWGGWCKKLCALRGAKRGKGGDRKSTATLAVDSVAKIAKDLGVSERTARYRMKRHDEQEARERGERVAKPTKGKKARAEDRLLLKVYLARKNHGDGRRICLEIGKTTFRVTEEEAIVLREALDAVLDEASSKAS